MKHRNLLILGASGGVGKWAVKIAKERGYKITVIVRSKASFENSEGIHVIEGNVLDNDVLEKAVQGQDAVLSCLGIKRKNQANPWSVIVSPTDFTEMVMKNTITIMENKGIHRLVTVSAAGVGDSWSSVSSFMKFMIASSNIKHAYKDFDNMEKRLKNSKIDSLSVRPVGFIDAEPTNKTQLVNQFNISTRISKSDVAKWMVNALEREERFEKPTEMIGWV